MSSCLVTTGGEDCLDDRVPSDRDLKSMPCKVVRVRMRHLSDQRIASALIGQQPPGGHRIGPRLDRHAGGRGNDVEHFGKNVRRGFFDPARAAGAGIDTTQ